MSRRPNPCPACDHLDTPSGLCPHADLDGNPLDGVECPTLCLEPGTHWVAGPGYPPAAFCVKHWRVMVRKLRGGDENA